MMDPPQLPSIYNKKNNKNEKRALHGNVCQSPLERPEAATRGFHQTMSEFSRRTFSVPPLYVATGAGGRKHSLSSCVQPACCNPPAKTNAVEWLREDAGGKSDEWINPSFHSINRIFSFLLKSSSLISCSGPILLLHM